MAQNDENNSHAHLYKNNRHDPLASRRRRTQMTVQLRKNKLGETLQKRRNIPTESVNSDSDPSVDNKTLLDIKNMALSDNHSSKLAAVQSARKMLSCEKYPPINDVIAIGMVPIFVDCLSFDQSPELQFEAAWALTNIASGSTDQTQSVVDFGACDHLIRLLGHEHSNVREQCVWCLGNIIGEGAKFRDYVVERGFMEPLLKLLNINISLVFLRNITWVFVNLCRHKSKPPSEQLILQMLDPLKELIINEDINTCVDALWAIAYLTDAGSRIIDMIIGKQFIPVLVHTLSHTEVRVKLATLRAIGNIVTGNEFQTQSVLEAGVFRYIPELLDSGRDKIIKETLWFLSNIAAGTPLQVQAVVNSDIVSAILILMKRGELPIQKECAWVISNIAINGTPEHVHYLNQCNVIPPMCLLLHINDVELLRVVLDGLKAILCVDPHNMALVIEDCGGLDTIENLQHSNNERVYKLVSYIIKNYFLNEDEDEVT